MVEEVGSVMASREAEKEAFNRLKEKILQLLKEIFDRIFPGKPMYYKALEETKKNLEEMTFQNTVTSEILNDLYTVVTELRGNIDNMSVEEAEQSIRNINAKLTEAKSKVEMKAIDEILFDENGNEKANYSLFSLFDPPSGGNEVFIAHTNKKGNIDGEIYRVVATETEFDKKTIFVTDVAPNLTKDDIKNMESIPVKQDDNLSNSDNIKVAIAEAILGKESADKYASQFKYIRGIAAQQEIMSRRHAALSDMSSLQTQKGDIMSYINGRGNFCVADIRNHKVVTFTSDTSNEIAKISDCDDNGISLASPDEGDMIAIWQDAGEGKIETIISYDRQRIRYNLLNYEATSRYLQLRNISIEQPSDKEKKSFIKNVSKQGNDIIYKIYDKMSSAKEDNVINKNWNVKCSNNTIEIITDKGDKTLFTFDENGNPDAVRHKNSNGREYLKTHKIDFNALEAINNIGMDINMPDDLKKATNLFLSVTKNMFDERTSNIKEQVDNR